jgi:hypothetical protein
MTEKFYIIGTVNSEAFNEIAHELCHEGCESENVPERCVECVNYINHSPTRGEFSLTDSEAELLRNDERIKFVNLNYSKYNELKPKPEDLHNTVKTQRNSNATKQYRNWADSQTLPLVPDASDLGRSGYQLLRCQNLNDPWYGQNDETVIQNKLQYQGDGSDVDVIVGDDGTWIGHPEFCNNTQFKPIGYTGGNVLPGNGYCDVLDLVLDAPYYIDPEYFEADPDTRLTTRFDGTTVPTESAANGWWGGSRSAKFLNFGNVTIDFSYTRANCNGDNTAISGEGNHGTACASLTFGKTHGWAFNSNKWVVNVYGSSGTTFEPYFDIVKLFHQMKPSNPNYGSKDPTICSNSYGFRATPPTAGYAYFRGDTTGVQWTDQDSKPEFIKYVGLAGDGGRMKGEIIDNSETEAGRELIESGVIFVAAAGNGTQKQVSADHPDYDNFYNNNANELVTDNSFNEFGRAVLPYTNRRGFPQQLGKTDSNVYPVINIGALDDAYQGDGKERKVNYSDMGNEIDCYAPADGTLAANRSYQTALPPGITANHPDTYDELEIGARDVKFSGTSAACPVACGLIATKLQYNRNWTYSDVRQWLKHGLEHQDSNKFYSGTEATTINGTEWSDLNNTQGSDPVIIYDLPIKEKDVPKNTARNLKFGGVLNVFNLAFKLR